MSNPQNIQAADKPPDSREALERLAAHLDPDDLRATVLADGIWPSLKVTSRHTTQLSEHIHADSGWFWWSWAERLAPIADPPTAAAKITRVLHAAPEHAND